MNRVTCPIPRQRSSLRLFLLLAAAPALWASAAEDPEAQAAAEHARRLEAVSHFECRSTSDLRCEDRKEALDRWVRIERAFANRASAISTPSPTGFSGISGTVTAANGGSPVAGAIVEAWRADGSGFGLATDAAGQYTLQIPPGTYYLTVSPTSGPYRTELYDDLPCPNFQCDFVTGTPVEVAADALTTGIDFALEPASAISGRVSDLGTGNGIDGVFLLLYDSLGVSRLSARTDAAGDYEFSDLHAGDYFIRALDHELYLGELYDDILCTGGACDIGSGDPVTTTVGVTTVGIDFELELADGVTGQVREASGGASIDSARVYLWTDSGSFAGSDSVDGAGNYAVGVPPGTYYVTVDTFGQYQDEVYDDTYCPRGLYCDLTIGDPVVVTAGAVRNVVAGIDFELEPGAEINGTVTNNGAPVSTGITVWNAAGTEVGSGFASTFSGGAYSVGGLASGSYFVTADDSGFLAGELYDDLPCPGGLCDPTAGAAVAVTAPATIFGIDFDLQEGPGISGRLTQPGGAPISSVSVRFWDSDSNFVGSTFSDANGDYSRALPSGSYFVSTRSFGVWADELYNDLSCPQGSCFPGVGDAVVVGSGPTTGIDFELTAAGSLTGTVRDQASMAPLAGFTVVAYAASGRFVGSTLTATNGSYTITGLAAGDHFVVASGRDFYLSELWNDIPCAAGCLVTTGTPVAIVSGSLTGGIDFNLDNGNGITGRVVAEGTGMPLVDFFVDVYDSVGDYVTTGVTDAAGDYQIGVQPGTYYLRTFSFPEPYFDELYDDLPCEPGCEVTGGAPVIVAVGSRAVTSGIDFELALGGEIAGTIETATSLDSFEVGTVEVWDSSGQLVDSTRRVLDGAFRVGPLSGGTYFVTVQPDNPNLEGQLFDGRPCPASACDPASGTAITVEVGSQTMGVDFNLPWSSTVLFIDGFERGNSNAWSQTVTP